MKNARLYERKIKKLLTGMSRPKPPEVAPADRIPRLLTAILEENATAEDAEKALAALRQEYVDFNELRVSPSKEMVERIGREYPQARGKAMTIVTVLNAIFDKTSTLTMDYMDQMAKRDLRRHLQEIGLSPFASALIVLTAFAGHAVPVDRDLVETLRMNELAHEESDIPDVQGFLERIVAQKDAWAAHDFLRKYIQKNYKALTVKRKAEAKAREEAERKRLAEEAAARAKAEKEAAEAEARRKAHEAAVAAKQAARLAKEAEKAARKSAKAKAGKKAKAPAKAKGKK